MHYRAMHIQTPCHLCTYQFYPPPPPSQAYYGNWWGFDLSKNQILHSQGNEQWSNLCALWLECTLGNCLILIVVLAYYENTALGVSHGKYSTRLCLVLYQPLDTPLVLYFPYKLVAVLQHTANMIVRYSYIMQLQFYMVRYAFHTIYARCVTIACVHISHRHTAVSVNNQGMIYFRRNKDFLIQCIVVSSTTGKAFAHYQLQTSVIELSKYTVP